MNRMIVVNETSFLPAMDCDLYTMIDGYRAQCFSSFTWHDNLCCQKAIAWIRAMAHSRHAVFDGPPVWIRNHWDWSPMEWPCSWCSIVEMDGLDCGGFAALSRYVMGLHYEGVCAVQIVEHSKREVTAEWGAYWKSKNLHAKWADGSFIYHEAVGIVQDKCLRLWDPSRNRWLRFGRLGSYGSIAALKVYPGLGPDSACEQGDVVFDGSIVVRNVWNVFDHAGKITVL